MINDYRVTPTQVGAMMDWIAESMENGGKTVPPITIQRRRRGIFVGPGCKEWISPHRGDIGRRRHQPSIQRLGHAAPTELGPGGVSCYYKDVAPTELGCEVPLFCEGNLLPEMFRQKR